MIAVLSGTFAIGLLVACLVLGVKTRRLRRQNAADLLELDKLKSQYRRATGKDWHRGG